jgi:16S rRNA G966 N2-methylase RsmD
VLTTLRQNIAALDAADRAVVHRGAALAQVEQAMPPGADAPWDVAFADPPYHKGSALALAERWLRAPFATIFGVEHEAGLVLPPAGPGQRQDRRQYGDTAITFYRMDS